MPARFPWYRATIGLGNTLLGLAHLDVCVHGAANLPSDGPLLLAANHISQADFLMVGKAMLVARPDRELRFLTRNDVWATPMLARAMDGMSHIPVDRRAPVGALLQAEGQLRRGESVCIFPEAGISFSYTIRALMPGAALLSQRTSAPVIPMAQWGAQRLISVRRPGHSDHNRLRILRGLRVDMAFGEPMEPCVGDYRAWTGELGNRLTQLLEELQELPHHQPRPREYAPWHPAHLGGHAPSREEARSLDQIPVGAMQPTWGPL